MQCWSHMFSALSLGLSAAAVLAAPGDLDSTFHNGAGFTVVTVAAVAPAKSSGGSYVLRKDVIASGGGRASDGGYVLVGTVGQPAAAVQSGGGYRLTGGFHQPRSSVPGADALFANGFE